MGEQQHQPGPEQRRFGRYLRQVRERRKLSLDAVEEMSAVYPDRLTKSHLSRIENGLAEPSFRKMFALSEIYGMPLTALAEQFELDLKREQITVEVDGKSEEEIRAELLELDKAGRNLEALELARAAIDRAARVVDDESGSHSRLRLMAVTCLIQLGRNETAKSEAEELLNDQSLTSGERFRALELFTFACLNLNRLTVASMAMDRADRLMADGSDFEPRAVADLASARGKLRQRLGRPSEAVEAYDAACSAYEALGQIFEACRARINSAACSIECGGLDEAQQQLEQALLESDAAGYERLMAFAQSNLGLVRFKKLDMRSAERWLIRSNAIARPREYVSLVFFNCYYLWQIAKTRDDAATVRSTERTLRSLLSRADEGLEEVQAFKSLIAEDVR